MDDPSPTGPRGLQKKYLDTIDEVLDAIERLTQDPDSLDQATVALVQQRLDAAQMLGDRLGYSKKTRAEGLKSQKKLSDTIDRLERSLDKHHKEAKSACQKLREIGEALERGRD